MANPLTFIMPLVEGVNPDQVGGALGHLQPQIDAALEAVGTLHYARFVAPRPLVAEPPASGGTGPVSTGPFSLADHHRLRRRLRRLHPGLRQPSRARSSTLLLSFSADGAGICCRVAEHVEAFIDCIARATMPRSIRRTTRSRFCQRVSVHRAAGARQRAGVTLDFADIQGTILHGYRVDLARHLVLRVVDAAGARAFSGSLVDPALGHAADHDRPALDAQAGVVSERRDHRRRPARARPAPRRLPGGLRARRGRSPPPRSSSATSATARRRAGSTASRIARDVASDPRASGSHREHRRARAACSATLRAAFGDGAARSSARWTPPRCPTTRFTSATPTTSPSRPVQGAPPPKRPLPDRQPVAPTGAFLLGYPNQNDGADLPRHAGAAVDELELRGVSAARAGRRRLRGVARRAPPREAGVDRELLAAKVCGRWRTGVPLVLSPDTATPDPPLAPRAHQRLRLRLRRPGAATTRFGYRCPGRLAHPPHESARRARHRRRQPASHHPPRDALRAAVRSRRAPTTRRAGSSATSSTPTSPTSSSSS